MASITKTKHYVGIDIAKLYCAFLVVMIHILEIPQHHIIASAIVSVLSQQAVPFFFIASGFFFAKYIVSNDLHGTLQYVKRNFLLYLFWVLLWSGSIAFIYLSKYSSSVRVGRK